MTRIIEPSFCTVGVWRDVVRNNARIHHIVFRIQSDENWLPHILTEAGFFPSGSELKRNRPDLWRDRERFDVVNLQWAQIEITP